MEKIMHKRMYAFLEKYEILYELQFGFRAGYSTTHALIHMTEAIRSALDSGLVTCGIFVDFQKAFDTVNHDIPYSYKFSRVLIFAHSGCAKFENFRADLFSRTLNFDNFRAD